MNTTAEERRPVPGLKTLLAAKGLLTRIGLVRLSLVLGITAIAGLQLQYLLRWSPYDLAVRGIFVDDAFVYTALARNFHEFGFLTLDGEMSTNGVQPLWMGLQLLLTKLWPNADETVLLARSSWLCYLLFSGLSTWFVTRSSTSLYLVSLSGVVMGGLVVLNVKFQQLVIKGLETPVMLVVLLLTLILIDAAAGRQLKPVTSMALAASAALCFFARTDLFWVSLVIGGWLLARRPRWQPFLVYPGVVSLLVLPYLAFNYFSQGAIVPISGRVKLHYLNIFYPSWRDYLLSDEWHGLFFAAANNFRLGPEQFILTIIATAAAIVGGQWLVWRGRVPFPPSIRIFSLVIIGHIIVMKFIYREARPYSAYYFVPELLWVVTVLAYYVTRCPGPNFQDKLPARWAYKALPLVIALASVWLARTLWQEQVLNPSPYWVERMNIIGDVQRILPDTEHISAFWPGTLAQFSGKLVTPLDGVVGSNDYFQNYVKPGREFNYILERSRPYLVVYFEQPPTLLFSKTKPQVVPWDAGLIRLWEYGVPSVRVLSARTLEPQGQGWYLLELQASSLTKANE